MNKKNDPAKLAKIETSLAKVSRVTLAQNFPSWENLSKQEPKYPSLYQTPSPKGQIFSFPKTGKIWVGSALLAAATLIVVFLLKSPVTEAPVSEVKMASAKPIFDEVPAPEFKSILGTVSQSKGKNFIRKSDESETPLTKGMEVAMGDRLLVGKSNTVDIFFPNRVNLRLQGNSELEIVDSRSLLDSTQQLIRIWRGKVLVTLGKLTKDSSFEVASGEVGTIVRGTTFSVSYDGKNTQKIAVRDGSVAVLTSGKSESVVDAGKQIAITDNVTSELTSIAPKDDKEMKAFQTQVTLAREAKLYQEYSRLELVRMEDGTEYRGVIIGQSATHLELESLEGRMEIPIGKILETEKIR